MSSNHSQSFCLFCYKSSTASVPLSDDSINIKHFVKYLSRFVGHHKLNNILSEVFQIPLDLMIESCVECQSITNQFCEIYHQMKCLELELEWKLERFVDIIKLGGKVPSRISKLNSILKRKFENDLEKRTHVQRIIQDFRYIVVKKGRKRLRKCQPRVLINTISKVQCVSSEESGVDPTNEEDNNTNNLILDIPSSSCIKHEDNTKDSNICEANDDADGFCHFDSYQHETDDSFPDTNFEQLENDDQTSLCENDPMDLDTSGYFKELQTQERNELIVSEENVSQWVLNSISEPSTSQVTVTQNIDYAGHSENSICDTLSSPCRLIPLKFESEEITVDSGTVINNLEKEDTYHSKVNEIDVAEERGSITIVSTISLEPRYNLRDKRKSKIVKSDEIMSDLNDNDYSTSSSSTDSDSSSENETESVPSNSSKKPRGRPKATKEEPQRKFKCLLYDCHIVFQDENTYLNHKNLHSEGKFSCNLCDLVETNLIKLSSHEYKKHLPNETKGKDINHRISVGRRWTCPRCGQACRCKSAYQAHFAYAHFGVGQEIEYIQRKVKRKRRAKKVSNVSDTLKCNICQKQFENRDMLDKHRTSYHNFEGAKFIKEATISSSSTSKASDIFKCKFCDKILKNAHDLAVHEIEHAVDTQPINGKQFKCPRCPFNYNLLGVYIKHHMKSHLNVLPCDLPGACTMCSGESVYILNSKAHYDRHHNLELLESPNQVAKCDECSAYFLRDFQLLVHKTKVHLVDNHKCEFCEKVYSTRKRLLNHKNVVHKYYDEDPKLPFGCDMEGCKKRYGNKAELDYHKRFHKSIEVSHQRGRKNGTKCSKCGMICKSKTALTRHKSSSHSVKSVCQECGKTFKNKQILQVHLEYHKHPEEWKFECSECGKKCADKHKLKMHIRTHTKEKPFVCQFCGEKYAHRHNWRSHLETKHGDEEGAQEDIIGRKINKRDAIFLSRKGSKKGDCIIAGKSLENNN